jgi:uncharacterized protein (TIGR02145 family)
MKSNFSLLTVTILLSALYSSGQETGTFTDSRDGHVYKTVKIGNQTWMAENLAYLPKVCKHKEDCGYWVYDYEGKKIQEAIETRCYKTYGVLYSTLDTKNICPAGWHLPSKDEWFTLLNNLGGIDAAGIKLKSASGWSNSTIGSTNESGFNALPGGMRYYYNNGNYGEGNFALFLSSTTYENKPITQGNFTFGVTGTDVWVCHIEEKNDVVKIDHHFCIGYGGSVRCLKDE